MSRVRVLAGTRKGAFVLTSDGKREKWEVARKVGSKRSPLCRLGAVSPEGLAGRPESHLCLAVQRLVRADHSALRRRRQDLDTAWDTPGRKERSASRTAQR